MLRLIVRATLALVLILVLLVAVDRGAAFLVARSVSQGVQQAQHLPAPPEVAFPDVPFLTQAIRGWYDQVDVTMRQVPTGGALVIDEIDATLFGVRADVVPALRGELTTLPVQRADATAFVSFASLQAAAQKLLGGEALSVTISQAGTDRVTVALGVSTPLGKFTVSGQAELSVVDGVVKVHLLPATFSGVPSFLREQLLGRIDLSALVPELPFGFRATGVTVESSGLRVIATGTGLSIPI